MAFQDMEKTWPVWRTHHCTHEAGCVRLAIRLETSLPVFEHLRKYSTSITLLLVAEQADQRLAKQKAPPDR
jgi:hypothetical protein